MNTRQLYIQDDKLYWHVCNNFNYVSSWAIYTLEDNYYICTRCSFKFPSILARTLLPKIGKPKLKRYGHYPIFIDTKFPIITIDIPQIND